MSSLDVSFDPELREESADIFKISPMINFMTANKKKIMQVCLDDDMLLDLMKFDEVFEHIMNDKIDCALVCSKRITAIILDILDYNINF